jgi:hypothetical protein
MKKKEGRTEGKEENVFIYGPGQVFTARNRLQQEGIPTLPKFEEGGNCDFERIPRKEYQGRISRNEWQGRNVKKAMSRKDAKDGTKEGITYDRNEEGGRNKGRKKGGKESALHGKRRDQEEGVVRGRQ